MSETPTEPQPTEEISNEPTPAEIRRMTGIEVGTRLAIQRQEGIDALLNYAEAVTKYLDGEAVETIKESLKSGNEEVVPR